MTVQLWVNTLMSSASDVNVDTPSASALRSITSRSSNGAGPDLQPSAPRMRHHVSSPTRRTSYSGESGDGPSFRRLFDRSVSTGTSPADQRPPLVYM